MSTISPRQHTQSAEFVPDDFMSTGVPGLDDPLGGGIVEGGTFLLEHDGKASPHSLLTNMLARAIDRDMATTLVPPVEVPPKRLETVVAERIGPMERLMEADRLFLVDFASIWENTRRNVFKPQDHDTDNPAAVFRTIDDNGLQYLEMRKSPAGYLGATRLVEYLEDEPDMQIQRPPGAGESTEGDGF